MESAIYAKMVMKVGDRAYWETWARDVARIAETHITRIKAIVQRPIFESHEGVRQVPQGPANQPEPRRVKGRCHRHLRHLITRPVFDALFANYVFTERNPVSHSMQKMLDVLHQHSLKGNRHA